jgi:SAM-dependent methyltransferase
LELNENSIFVDIGCGDGELLIAAARRGVSKCVGFEIDVDRATKAKQRVSEAGFSNTNIEIVVGDATDKSVARRLTKLRPTAIATFLVNSKALLKLLSEAGIHPINQLNNIDDDGNNNNNNNGDENDDEKIVKDFSGKNNSTSLSTTIKLVSYIYKLSTCNPISNDFEQKVWLYEFSMALNKDFDIFV